MKIIPENVIKINRDIAKKQSLNKNKDASEAASDPALRSSACDKITIESSQGPALSDAELIAQLKKNILSDIQAGTPEHKLNDLKQQIALDEYDVNIPDIIRKLMLDEGSYE